MKKAILATVLALMLPVAAHAGLISSGETLLAGPPGLTVYVDWEVYDPGDATAAGYVGGGFVATDWYYFYQVEVSATPFPLDGVGRLTVDAGALSYVIPASASFASGVNLSQGGFETGGLYIDPISSTVSLASTSWDFLKLLAGPYGVTAGSSSSALYFRSDRGPIPGGVHAIDGFTGDGVARVPGVPAPGAALLIGLGLSIISWIRRRVA